MLVTPVLALRGERRAEAEGGCVPITPIPALRGERREVAGEGCVEQTREGRDARSESQTSLEEACAPRQPAQDSEHPNETTGETHGEVQMRLSSAEAYGSFKYNVVSGATVVLKELQGRSRLQAEGVLEERLKECSDAISGSDHSTVKPRSVIIGGKSSNSIWPEQSGEHPQGAVIHLPNTANLKSKSAKRQLLVARTCYRVGTYAGSTVLHCLA